MARKQKEKVTSQESILNNKRRVPVIIGPTCIGKTDLALKIAKETNSHIISIDSRQVFEKLDIGTGKVKNNSDVLKTPIQWVVNGVKIFGYDIFKPNEEVNAFRYAEIVKKILEIYHNDKFVITCGTGFYLDFLMGNLEYSRIDLVRKAELAKLSKDELVQIYENYKDTSPIDLNNKVRLITRILTLENPDKTKLRFEIPETEFEIYYLTDERDYLYLKADQFVDSILDQNVVGEYLDVLNTYGEIRPLKGLIYREIGEYLHQEISYEELRTKCQNSLHAYIRRQETYFKKFKVKLKTDDKDLIFSSILKEFNL